MNEKKTFDTPNGRGSTLKRYASKVFRESSVGMVSSLAETSSKPRKCFKVFVLIFCLTGFLYQSAKFLTVVFEYPTSVDIDIIRPTEFFNPAYSFCDNNGIKRSLFCEKYPESCEEPDDAFCEKYEDYCGENKTLVPKREFYNVTREMSVEEIMMLNANLSDFLLDRFRNQREITGPFMRIDIEDHNILMCYSFNDRVNSSRDPLQSRKQPLFKTTIGEFKFYVDESDMFVPGVRPGILFSIHSPFLAVNPIENGIFMKPGRTYVIYVSMEEEVLLKKPYETDCINYTEFWENNGRTGPRCQEMCKHSCFQDLSMTCYNCIVPVFLFPTNEKLCSLSSKEMQEKDCDTDSIREQVMKCEETCKDDCKRTKYSYTVQERYSMKFDNEGQVLEDIDRLIFVKIYLEDDEIIVLQHSPKYMIVEVFSTIGGFIGGWLGISLLDVTDIFEGFFRIIRYAFK